MHIMVESELSTDQIRGGKSGSIIAGPKIFDYLADFHLICSTFLTAVYTVSAPYAAVFSTAITVYGTAQTVPSNGRTRGMTGAELRKPYDRQYGYGQEP